MSLYTAHSKVNRPSFDADGVAEFAGTSGVE
ncbi:hypothetical protein MBRU_19070 [Mycolicibacterium brumae DSM 44177]|nr:hypothetical protein MBRU_19070 [Mycolicibacterium brumae DSM 44177]